MTTVVFDTLKFANRLKSAGVASAHAEAEAQALAEVFDLASRDIVTKEYLSAQMIQLEQRLTIKLGAMLVAAVGVTATLVKLL